MSIRLFFSIEAETTAAVTRGTKGTRCPFSSDVRAYDSMASLCRFQPTSALLTNFDYHSRVS